MKMKRPLRWSVALTMLLLVGSTVALAQEPLDEEAITAIRHEAMDNSQVMDILSWMTDVHGPRLTGSKELDEAEQWAVDEMKGFGLENVHLEPWGPFGRGWTLNRFSMNVESPVAFPVIAYPKAWSGSTDGTITGEVILLEAETVEDLEAYRGKLQGKIVMVEPVREIEEPFEPLATRRDADDLLDMADYSNVQYGEQPQNNFNRNRMQRFQLARQRMAFLYEEQPAAILDRGSNGDYGTLFVSAASVPNPEGASFFNRPSPWNTDGDVIPQVTVAVEQYNRMVRIIKKGLPVTVDLNIDASYNTDDPMEYNVVGEIPGTDPDIGDEVVMLGGHFDSWHAGTGATDNGAGSAVMMEVMRVLKSVFAETGKQPRRTIRIALWTGEEQGLFGSRNYVNDHFATMQGFGQPPTALKPEHDKLSAYYNLDNGSGKIRGVYLQGNSAVAPIFRAWLTPFHDDGAATLTLRNTGGTDHLSFDAAGLPGFQFIQEPLAYSTRTHHSNMDVYDHTIGDDLKQAATIIASFVYHTAQRDQKLPRKPLPMEVESSSGGE